MCTRPCRPARRLTCRQPPARIRRRRQALPPGRVADGFAPSTQQQHFRWNRAYRRRRAAASSQLSRLRDRRHGPALVAVILIIWGVVKLYERTASQREGGPPSRTTAGEVFLMLGLLALLGVVIGVDYAKQNLSGVINDDFAGDSHDYDLNVSPAPVPADAHIVIRNGRGDITVR